MSGGSLDYICFKVEEAASSIRSRATCAEHRAFAAHLAKVAEALHDIEWVFSGDTRTPREIPAIMAVISKSEVIEASLESARAARDELTALIANAETSTPSADKRAEEE